ncbi:conserved hypothetical protein [Neospora caninum Liverpool]|uniref:Uncharacterized protein n=1 Tax=Neospora caninum (strain Liverpool) TaxID=572307 RepID=F0VMV6_NEOCL|nr:conserved hypothetical protein [Neospora caninum Liverpool]CBZ55052.1 conserved hypothetical protein [Neospora caninum Liverpool]CEL69776.1 TPA: hypothetical protein BN1204_054770 [Neospora caninum Liverpool]|eukprot:XP_003885080.1 conserved hypothetical protein [Neospora caninum Liverpool]
MTSGWSEDFLQGTSGAWQQQLQQHEQLSERLAFLRRREEQLEAELQHCRASLRESVQDCELQGGDPTPEERHQVLPHPPLSVPSGALSPSRRLAPGVYPPQDGGFPGVVAFARSVSTLQNPPEALSAPSAVPRIPPAARLDLRLGAEIEARGFPLFGPSASAVFPQTTPSLAAAHAPETSAGAPQGGGDALLDRTGAGANAATSEAGGTAVFADSAMQADGAGSYRKALETRRVQLVEEKERLKEMQRQYEQLLDELQQQRQQQMLLQLQPPEGLHCGPAGKQALRQFFEQAYMLSRPAAASAASGSFSPGGAFSPPPSSSPLPLKVPSSSPSGLGEPPTSLAFSSPAGASLPPQLGLGPASLSSHSAGQLFLSGPVGRSLPAALPATSAFLPGSALPPGSSDFSSRSAAPPLLSNVSPALVVCRKWQATQGLRDPRAAALVSLLRAMGVKRNVTYRGVFETALRPKLLVRALKLRTVIRRFFGDGRRAARPARGALSGDSGEDGVDLSLVKAVVVPHLGPEGESIWRDWVLEHREEKESAGRAAPGGDGASPSSRDGSTAENVKAAGGAAAGVSVHRKKGAGRRPEDGDGVGSRRGSVQRGAWPEEDRSLFPSEGEVDGAATCGGEASLLGVERQGGEGDGDHEALRAIEMLYSAVGRLAPMFQVRPLQPILAGVIDALQPLPLPPTVMKMLLDDTPAARDFYKLAHTRTKHLIWLRQPWKFFTEVAGELDACVTILNAMCLPAAGPSGSPGQETAARASLASPSASQSPQASPASPESLAGPRALLQQHIQKLLDMVDGNPAVYNLLTLFIRLKFILSLLPPRGYVIDLRNKPAKTPGDPAPGADPSPPPLSSGSEKGWGGAAGGHYIPIIPAPKQSAGSAHEGTPRRPASGPASGPRGGNSLSLERPASPRVSFAASAASGISHPRHTSRELLAPPDAAIKTDPDAGGPPTPVARGAADGAFCAVNGAAKKSLSPGRLPDRQRGIESGGTGEAGFPPDGGGRGREAAKAGDGGARGDTGSGASRAQLTARMWPQAECHWGYLRCLLAVGYRDRFHCDDAEMRSVDACWGVILLVSEVIRSGTNSMDSVRRRDDLLKPAKAPFPFAPSAETAEKGFHIRSSNDLLDVCIALMHPLFLQAVAQSLALSFYRPDFHPLIFRNQERIWRAFAVLGLSAPYVGLTKFILESRPVLPAGASAPLSPSGAVSSLILPVSLETMSPAASVTPAGSASGASSLDPLPAGEAARSSLTAASCPSPALRLATPSPAAQPQSEEADAELPRSKLAASLPGDETQGVQISEGPTGFPSSPSLRAAFPSGCDLPTPVGACGQKHTAPGDPLHSAQPVPSQGPTPPFPSGASSPPLAPDRSTIGFPPCPPGAGTVSGVRTLPHAGAASSRPQKRTGNVADVPRGPPQIGGKTDDRQKRRKACGLDIPLAKLVAYAAGSSTSFPGVGGAGAALGEALAGPGMFWLSLSDLSSTHSFLSAYLPRFHNSLYVQCTHRLQAFFDLARAAATAAAAASTEDGNCSLAAAEAVAAAALSGSECGLLSASSVWSSEDEASKAPGVRRPAQKDPAGVFSPSGNSLDSLQATEPSPGMPQVARLKERLRTLAKEAAGAWPPGTNFVDLPLGGNASAEEQRQQDVQLPLDCLSATIAALTHPPAGAEGAPESASAAGPGGFPGSEIARRKTETACEKESDEGRQGALGAPCVPLAPKGLRDRGSGAEPPPASSAGGPNFGVSPPGASPSLPPPALGTAGISGPGGQALPGAPGAGGVVAFCARFRAAVQHCGDEGVCRRLLVAGRTEIVLARLILTCLLPLTAKSEAFRALQHSILRRVAYQAQTLLLLSASPDESGGKDSEASASESGDEEKEAPGSRDARAIPDKASPRLSRTLSLAEVDWLFLISLRTFLRLASLQPQEGAFPGAVPGSPLDGERASAEVSPGFFQTSVLVEMAKLLSLLAERHPLFLQLSVDLLKVPAVARAVGSRGPNLLMHAWKLGKQHFSKRPTSIQSLMFAKSFGEAVRLSRLDVSPAELAELTGLPGGELPPSRLATSTAVPRVASRIGD